jgi:hypothetical protein
MSHIYQPLMFMTMLERGGSPNALAYKTPDLEDWQPRGPATVAAYTAGSSGYPIG